MARPSIENSRKLALLTCRSYSTKLQKSTPEVAELQELETACDTQYLLTDILFMFPDCLGLNTSNWVGQAQLWACPVNSTRCPATSRSLSRLLGNPWGKVYTIWASWQYSRSPKTKTVKTYATQQPSWPTRQKMQECGIFSQPATQPERFLPDGRRPNTRS